MVRAALYGASFSLVLAATAGPVSAYTINPAAQIHERLTVLSEQCAADGKAERCDLPDGPDAMKAVAWKGSILARATRWPDNPTDQISVFSIAKFGVNVAFKHCKPLLERQGYDGLLCNSHYGSAQFMHSMHSPGDAGDMQTRRRILDWVRFTYRVATGRIAASDNFCQSIAGTSADLAEAITPADFPYCGRHPDGSYAPGGVDGVWSVGNFFTFSCRNPLHSNTCGVAPADVARERAPIVATGAILHLIQDSFSRGHTGRGAILPKGPYVPAVECASVQRFYDYNENAKVHAKSDGYPAFDRRCGASDALVLDPVTAGARMLLLIRAAHPDEDAAVQLVSQGVLGQAS